MNEHRRMYVQAARWAGVLAALTLCTPASALDYQIHGFAAQGFAVSDGNNVLGNSTHGSHDYYEVGVNTGIGLLPQLHFSAQALVRDAGASDNGKPRLDFALVDWRILSESASSLGLRAGRVKNSYGLFNDTRDVIFTRPSILLPQSVYFEGQGPRSLLFTSDGVQAYGGHAFGGHYSSLSLTHGLDYTIDEDTERQFSGGINLPGDYRHRDIYAARLQDEWQDAGVTTALSYLQGNFLFLPDPGVPLSLDLDFKLYALSGRYDAERFSLTTEYVYSTFAGNFNGTNLSSTSDGAYVQGDYRLNPAWTVMARYDASFSDNGDRDGSECRDFVSGMPRDPHGCFAHDFMLGGNWKYGEHWGVWAEGHLIDGNSTVSPGDNAGRTPENHWSLFLLMAAYRF